MTLSMFFSGSVVNTVLAPVLPCKHAVHNRAEDGNVDTVPILEIAHKIQKFFSGAFWKLGKLDIAFEKTPVNIWEVSHFGHYRKTGVYVGFGDIQTPEKIQKVAGEVGVVRALFKESPELVVLEYLSPILRSVVCKE